jgi:hypothetical protein
MRIAPALLLTALGGILADAVTLDVPGIDLNALGVVLFFVGLLWLAVEVFIELSARRRPRAPRAAPPPPRREPARTYDPVMRQRPSRPPVDPDAPTEAVPRRPR